MSIFRTEKTCRACGDELSNEPLLRYENMPASAQHLPTSAQVADDRGICLEVYQCLGCALVQLDREPVAYFRDVIRSTGFSPRMLEFRRGQFRDFLTKHSLGGKKVLEVGCGRGEFVELFSQCGAEAHGIEHLDSSVREANTRGLRVEKIFLDRDAPLVPAGPFDGFFFSNFLEHLPNPADTLRALRRNLRRGAVGLVEVPNFDMIRKQNLFSEFISDHLLYFTRETLTHFLEGNGFEVMSCEEICGDYVLSAEVKRRERVDLSLFTEQQRKTCGDLREFVGRFPRVAVWGAGHQSFTLLSLAGLGKEIAYIVDSASFKQGKFAPATRIPIHAPSRLLTEPVDAVVVIAGGYGEEILRIITEKFDTGQAVASVDFNQVRERRE